MSLSTLLPPRDRARPAAPPAPAAPREAVLELADVGVAYGGTPAVTGVTLSVCDGEVTAIIGPSGCGKSSLLRSLNRMNDLVAHATVSGRVTYRGEDLYGPRVDPVEVRRRIGMVFQKPNPFPKSIYDNVAFGPRAHGVKRGLDEVVERSLQRAALWDEVSSRLDQPATALSGGQQQRLCIARALAVDPDVLLMDEPCSALDPIATSRIEDLVRELRDDVAIVIVTHNLQQAARVSDRTVFITAEVRPRRTSGPAGREAAPDGGGGSLGEVAGEDDVACGLLVEAGPTDVIFSGAEDERTRAYVAGQFG